MSNLLSFLFNTLRVRAIDPGNARLFLPTVLSGAPGHNSKGKLLPIEQASWSLGPIKGAEGTTLTTAIADNWAAYLEHEKVDLSSQYPIADPASPHPTLSFGDGKTKVVIDGLQNVFVLPGHEITPLPDGYRARITMQFDRWDGKEGRPGIARLSVAGPYRLEQALCVAGNGSNVCNGVASTHVLGGGTVSLGVDGAFLDAVAKLSIATDATHGPSVLVTVESLLARGRDANTPPSISIGQIEIDASVSQELRDIWKLAATNAIESADGQAGIVANLNAALNDPANRAALSAKMTQNLAHAIDGLTGPAPPTIPTDGAAGMNPIDRHLFNRLRHGLNDPTSRLFLPTVLASSRNPSLSPLRIARIDLPDFSALVDFRNNLLTDFALTGLVNAKASAANLVFDGGSLRFIGDLGGWNPPPHVPSGPQVPAPPAHADAQLSLTPAGGAQPLTGGIALTVKAAQLSGACRFSGDVDADLTIDVNALAVVSHDPVGDLHLELLAESQFKAFIDKAVNTANILGRIVAAVNGSLSSHLREIGADLSRYVRRAIADALR